MSLPLPFPSRHRRDRTARATGGHAVATHFIKNACNQLLKVELCCTSARMDICSQPLGLGATVAHVRHLCAAQYATALRGDAISCCLPTTWRHVRHVRHFSDNLAQCDVVFRGRQIERELEGGSARA